MRGLLGGGLFGLGIVLYFVFGIWALLLDLSILNAVGGFWLALLGFVLFPVMLAFAPFYALVEWGIWTPLVVSYGGGILATLLLGLGSTVVRLGTKAATNS